MGLSSGSRCVVGVCVEEKETNEKERACEGDLIVCTGVGEEVREYRVYIGESERVRARGLTVSVRERRRAKE